MAMLNNQRVYHRNLGEAMLINFDILLVNFYIFYFALWNHDVSSSKTHTFAGETSEVSACSGGCMT